MMRKLAILAAAMSMAVLTPVWAQDASAPIPACAMSGATSVMFNGKPALRLSDVINCPPESYQIVQSVMIEGQPMVQFKPAAGEKGNCTVKPSNDITVEGKATQALGDVTCTTN
mgnify:CR=1 FL=1